MGSLLFGPGLFRMFFGFFCVFVTILTAPIRLVILSVTLTIKFGHGQSVPFLLANHPDFSYLCVVSDPPSHYPPQFQSLSL